jgi:hypothetical protein
MTEACARCGAKHLRCTAHVKSLSGLRPCGRWPINGGRVCASHGGRAPAVRAAARRRVALADALAAHPQRHPGEVLLHAVHVLDTVAEMMRADLGDGSTAEQVGRYLDAVKDAAGLARLALGVDADDRAVRAAARAAAAADSSTTEGEIRDRLRAVRDEADRRLNLVEGPP